MSTAFWRKVSTKSLASRSLKRPRILLPGEESENFIKEESRASRWNSKADIAPGPLSNEKSQVKLVLNEFFRFPRKSPAPPVVPNFATSLRSFGTTANNSVASDWPFTRRNVGGEMTLRWKSAQSSCEKDSQSSRESRKCIEDHRQSAEICGKAREKCDDDNRVSAEDYRESCCEDSPKSHRERSIESGALGYSDTPVVPYNDWRASESTKRDSRGATRITCKSWTRGKLATEGKIYHKCKPKPCTYPHGRKKTIRSALYSPEDCSEEKSNLRKMPEKAATAAPSCSRSTAKPPSCMKTFESEMPSSMPSIDDYEKPDPPPPRYPHWTENPPSNCDHCSRTAIDTSTVKSSPMIFIPKKELRKSRVKDTAPSLRDIPQSKSECGKTDVGTKISPCTPSSQLRESLMSKCISPRYGIPFEDKCADSLTLPAPVDKTKQKIQWFPTLTREGRCHAAKPGKKFAMSDVSDCKPNVASFKYRLSKCPCSSGTHNPDVDRKSSVDVGIRQRQDDPLCRDKETNELESRRETAKGGRKRVKLRTRQRYKVRLKMLRKGDKRPDPSRIAELGQPRDGRTRSPLSKEVRSSVTEEDELSPRLRNSCSDYCPPERPVAEHKSYPTKMEESRAKSRSQSQEKCPRTKRR